MSIYNYDTALQEWLNQGQYGHFLDTTGDVGSNYALYTPQDNPFLTGATYSGSPLDSSGITGSTFNEDNFDQWLRAKFGISNNITGAQLKQYFNGGGAGYLEPRQAGGIHDWAPLGQAVLKAIAMYFGGPAAVAGSIASGAATTAGASPAASTAIGAAVGSAEGITGAGQGAGTTAGTTAGYGDAGYSGSAAGGMGGGGGGGAGGGLGSDTGSFDQSGSQGVFDSSGNPLYQNTGSTQEPGMWDWLDSMDETGSFDQSGSQGVFDSSGNPIYSSPSGADETGAFDQFGSNTGPNGDTTIFNGTDSNPFGDMSLSDIISKYGQKGVDLIKGLVSRSGGGTSGTTTGGGILGNILNDPLSAAFDSTPFLLALNEANKQSGDLNSILNGINGSAYTKAVLDPYDVDTGTGRAALQNDMALRGISGSSFGNTQLNNYDYTRALGRSDMASKAQLAAAQLQGSLVNTRNTNRNLLLGAGLNASAKLFAPQQDPFNLKALLGA